MYPSTFSVINNSLIQTTLITTPPIIILINYKQLNLKIFNRYVLRFPEKSSKQLCFLLLYFHNPFSVYKSNISSSPSSLPVSKFLNQER